MRAAVQTDIGKMEIRSVAVPRAGPGELVVRVRAALTCGTDQKIFDRGHVRFSPPLVMGHEFSGDVVEAGEGAPFEKGDAVMLGLSGPCGLCRDCLRGASNRCASPERELAWGAFAQFVRVPRKVAAQNAFRKPAGLSYESAAVLDPLACVAHGISRLTLAPGDRFCVLGTGAIGLLWIAALKVAGVKNVFALGRNDASLRVARQWGAEVVESPAEAFADVVVECVGTPEAWEEALDLAVSGGTVLFFGGCAPRTRVPFDAEKIHYGETVLAGSFHYRPEDAKVAVRWLSEKKIDPSPLFSGERSLKDLVSLFESRGKKQGIKFVLHP